MKNLKTFDSFNYVELNEHVDTTVIMTLMGIIGTFAFALYLTFLHTKFSAYGKRY